MERAPLKVELVSLLPVFYRICAKCNLLDYFRLVGVDAISDQLAGYPQEAIEDQRKLKELSERLTKDFGGSVVPVSVGLMSVRGLWLSLRHKLGKGPAVVIAGKRVLSGNVPYDLIKSAIEVELSDSQRSG